MTLMQAVQRAAERLDAAGVAFGQGTLHAFDEAAWLVLWCLGRPLDALDDQADSLLSTTDQAQVDALIEQRIRTRQPAAYLTGEAWLQGIPFHIDARSIVPRSFIAELIADGTVDPWLDASTQRVLDLCTGNGSLAVLAAMAWPEVSVVGSDLSNDALAVARRNVERHGLQDRIELVQGDGLSATSGLFDLVLCNPPYVNADAMAALPPEFLAEPALALAGGIDGMDFVRRLLAELPARLAPNGVLVLEIGHERAHFEAAFPRLEAVWLETSAGSDQVLLLTREALPA
ncbi:MAG: 50S ribosomal protein L3 N(5)-glutamine methyltransferase [Inhella sp.]|uniref:50S ribosomal protein L3 N(5)-glutamine methyltransferase n=1 Tax=Inhella sp. TaxID=1921806 RepID=UPI0022CCFC1A|nr:50S ribosomal protein L3 N(5)-glutamine methyltransferase [Inhella sp.]MCZ8234340.1 50S ribosomal protein L3 N(5)-glutamine methyltransferase [Inhella sp.]